MGFIFALLISFGNIWIIVEYPFPNIDWQPLSEEWKKINRIHGAH
jgi:hypothetical protein